jgi:hypothetical protein
MYIDERMSFLLIEILSLFIVRVHLSLVRTLRQAHLLLALSIVAGGQSFGLQAFGLQAVGLQAFGLQAFGSQTLGLQPFEPFGRSTSSS